MIASHFLCNMLFPVLIIVSLQTCALAATKLRPAKIQPRSGPQPSQSPANRHVFARQNVVWCNPYQYCMNSVCCSSADGYWLSCMPSDGDCCANGQSCPPGYACSTSSGYVICECVGSTCSQDTVDPNSAPPDESSSVDSYTSTSDDYDYGYTSTTMDDFGYTSTASAGAEGAARTTDDSAGPTSTGRRNSEEAVDKPTGGLTRSDKIALGCGIGVGLPATLAAIVTCILAVRRG